MAPVGLVVAIACGTLVLSAGTRANAQGARKTSPEARRERDAKAHAAFLAGRLQESLDLTGSLYAEFSDPIYLRNLGRCQHRLERPDAAIYYYKEYLSKAKHLNPRQVAETKGFIQEMEELKRKRESGAPDRGPTNPEATPAAGSSPSPRTGGDDVAHADAGTAPVSAVTASPAPGENTGLARDTALGLAAGLGAVGVTAVVVGGVLGLQAKAKADQSNEACAAGNICSPHGKELRDQALSTAGVSTIVFVAGGVFLGAGLYFFLNAPPAPQTTARLHPARPARFTPQVSAHGALLLVRGEF